MARSKHFGLEIHLTLTHSDPIIRFDNRGAFASTGNWANDDGQIF